MKTKTRILRGFGAVAALLCALCIGLNIIASSADYKGMVDTFLGGTSAKGGSSETYAYRSDYNNLTELLTERVRIAEQLGEEGCVLLKNENAALPLRQNGESGELKVTVLGNRPYTYKSDGTLRDTDLTFYGGKTGSRIFSQTITTLNADGDEVKIKTPVTLEDALSAENITMNPSMKSFYSSKAYSPLPGGTERGDGAGAPYAIEEPAVALSDVQNYTQYSDACIVVIGRTSGEGRDYLPGSYGVKKGSSQKSAIGLSTEELQLITVANEIAPGKVIVLVNSAVAMEIDELKNDARVNSVLWIGIPGSFGLSGVARVLSGTASPSGHLTDTYAVAASNAPAARNFGDRDPDGNAQFAWSNGNYKQPYNGHYVVMAEDIYTGYYYYETRYNDAVLGQSNASSAAGASNGNSQWVYEDEVTYPFGYGLSYTQFEQKLSPTVVYDEADKTLNFTAEVTNKGAVAGKSVVQLYVQTPYTPYDVGRVEKSAIQLITFEKTDVLQPEETVTVELKADIKYFASYDKTVSHDGVTGGYILEDGDYYFAIGNGAHEALNNILHNCLNVPETDLYLEEGSAINADGTAVWDIATAPDISFDSNGVNSAYLSKSANETVIGNQMENSDYNYFNAGVVTYLTRSDWEGTFPKSYTQLATTAEMDHYLKDNAVVYTVSAAGSKPDYVRFDVDHTEDYDEETGEPLENTDIASYKGKAYEDESWDYLLQQIYYEEAWKFAPYGGSSCKAFKSVNAPEVWQIDGPNGNINYGYSDHAPSSGEMAVSKSEDNAGYKSCDMPCAPMIAATFNKELLEEEGEIFGEDCLWTRNPIMWAPGMNLHRTQFNSRNHEYYSEDPILTNKLGVAFVRGGLRKGALLSAKHFAFNTQESYREGLTQFFEEQSGREMELRAFQGLCEDVNFTSDSGNRLDALGLMTSFSRVGVCGVNAHEGLMKNILRKEWGFKGLSSTDMVSDVGFFNPIDAVVNNVTFMASGGASGWLEKPHWSGYNNKGSIKNDPTMMTALYDNMHYYMYSIANSSALNGMAPGDVITETMSWWQYALIGVGAGTGGIALILLGLGFFFEFRKKPKKIKEEEAEQGTEETNGEVAENAEQSS